MRRIDSTFFGNVSFLHLGEDAELYGKLQAMVEEYPANAFEILNKLINKKGMKILIDINDKGVK
jgi:hypothetical protein